MWYSFINRLKASFGLADVVDILVVAFLVYEAIILVRKTRTAQLAKGIIALLLVWAVASFAPVSYTHLDVYKRQKGGRAACRAEKGRGRA